MPLPPGGITLPNVYTLIAHFTGVDITETWRSEFRIFASAGIPAPLSSIVAACQLYWLGNLRTDCSLDHLELRNTTWGDIPYASQAALWTHSVVLHGTKTVAYGTEGSGGIGKEVCAYVKISNAGPKPGKQFLRQLLDNGDVGAVPGSEWEFLTPPVTPNVTPAKFSALVTSSGLAAFFGGAADPRLSVAHFSIKEYNLNPANLPFEGSVSSIDLIKPTTNKTTRKNKK